MLGIVLVTGLLAYFAGTMYRVDVDLVYGRDFKKLDELIAEMEELRS